MVSLMAPCFSIFCTFSHQPISVLNSPSCFFPIVFVVTPPKREHPLQIKTKKHLKQRKFNQPLLGFCGVVRRCKSCEGESELALEFELLEFMKNSKNPNMFPSKKELIEGGRTDLVDGIMKSGGWMAMGWGDDVESEVSEDGFESNWEFGLEKYGCNGGAEVNEEERHCKGGILSDTSSSGRSLEMEAEDDSGIEGILHRLERQRNLSFGLKMGKNGAASNHVNGDFDDSNQDKVIRKDVDSCHPQSSEPAMLNHDIPMYDGNGLNVAYSNGLSSSLRMDTWRTWSIQRAGVSNAEFEADEIDFGDNTNQVAVNKPMGEIVAITADIKRAQDEKKDLNSYYREITRGDLKACLQNLEAELSSALHVLRSNTADLSGKAKDHLPEDLRQLSDVSEFQENEIMNSQDKLRSLRAKLAVLEGKMSLAINDAQKILDEKQKRIDDARKVLQLLRTTCIVWPNSGSEVLLAGSFDGWASQRKMTRSSTGVFSLSLKLYPGKYEIKFIVDGVWKVDPLRPIVNNNGFENNLLTIT